MIPRIEEIRQRLLDNPGMHLNHQDALWLTEQALKASVACLPRWVARDGYIEREDDDVLCDMSERS